MAIGLDINIQNGKPATCCQTKPATSPTTKSTQSNATVGPAHSVPLRSPLLLHRKHTSLTPSVVNDIIGTIKPNDRTKRWGRGRDGGGDWCFNRGFLLTFCRRLGGTGGGTDISRPPLTSHGSDTAERRRTGPSLTHRDSI